jgi:molecular chaperone DnaK
MRAMGYQLGVDLGTTYTAAALYRDGRVEVVPLGDRSTVIPSVAFVRPDGEVLVGVAANRRGVLEPERVAREFKRRVGDPTPLVVGGSPYPAEALMAHLLRAVVAEVSEREGADPDGLALTHPANWGAYKLDFLRQAVAHAEVACPVTYLSEPEAAAMHYAAGERVPAGTVVAVYDLGGGTFDAAVLRRNDAGGFEVAGQPQGIERLGGVDFDAGIFAHVDQALAGAVSNLEWDDEAALQAVARLRTECVEAKEALTRDTDVVIPAVLPDRNHTVRLTRAEFEAMIRPALGETITALRRALTSADVTPQDVHAVLLVGGSSRIPLVAQMVTAALERPTAVDAHPKHAVAQGAAIAAAQRAGATTPDAVTVAHSAETAAPPITATLPPDPQPIAAPPPPDPPTIAAPPAPGPSVAVPPPEAPLLAAPPSGAGAGPAPGVAPSTKPFSGRARITLVGVVVLLVAVIAAIAARPDGDEDTATGQDTNASGAVAEDPPEPHVPDPPTPDVPQAPEPTLPPRSGTPPSSNDPETQSLVEGCAVSALDDCDRLYDTASSEAETAFARTCGNRLDTEDATGDCIVTFDAIPTETDPELQTLINGCGGSAVDDCDRLYDTANGGPSSTYAQTCGNRLDAEDASGDCIVTFDAIPTDTNPDVQALIDGCAGDAVDDCDRLYDASSGGPSGTYAQTCGHRLDAEDASGDCIVMFDAIPTDTDSDVQALIDGCAGDAVDDCDRLYDTASGGPAHTYAQTCGHRLDAEDASGDCIVTLDVVPTDDDPEVQALIEACGNTAGDCDRLYDATDSGPPHTYAQTCGHRLDDDEASGDCTTRISSAE